MHLHVPLRCCRSLPLAVAVLPGPFTFAYAPRVCVHIHVPRDVARSPDATLHATTRAAFSRIHVSRRTMSHSVLVAESPRVWALCLGLHTAALAVARNSTT